MIFIPPDAIDNTWICDFALKIIICAGIVCFFIRFLYFFTMGYIETHFDKKVMDDQGNHKKFEDGKHIYDNAQPTWGLWSTKIIDSGVATGIFLLLLCAASLISNPESAFIIPTK